MDLFKELFEIASISTYENKFAESKKVETRVLGLDKMNDDTKSSIAKSFKYLKSVSFKLDDSMNCFVQLHNNSITGKSTLWFNVVPAPITVSTDSVNVVEQV